AKGRPMRNDTKFNRATWQLNSGVDLRSFALRAFWHFAPFGISRRSAFRAVRHFAPLVLRLLHLLYHCRCMLILWIERQRLLVERRRLLGVPLRPPRVAESVVRLRAVGIEIRIELEVRDADRRIAPDRDVRELIDHSLRRTDLISEHRRQ